MDQRLFRLFGSAHKWVKVGWKKLVTEFSNETFNAQIANLYDFSASLYLHERFLSNEIWRREQRYLFIEFQVKKLDFLVFFKNSKTDFQFLITNNFPRTFYSPGNNKRWTKNPLGVFIVPCHFLLHPWWNVFIKSSAYVSSSGVRSRYSYRRTA